MEEGERMQLPERDKLRKTASKYDFVKVKVWLGNDANSKHYYVLSRYLVCRMLTVTKISQMKAVKIALELKKQLVDEEMLDVSQAHLESTLFAIMRDRGFGSDYIKRYKMVNSFFQQRRPLIILICGVPCSGKSTIAQALASRLNLPNVLQTDLIQELLLATDADDGDRQALWLRDDLDDSELIAEFQKEARLSRKGVTGDLVKTIRDGKPIVIEGAHIDPGLYLYEFGHRGLAHLHEALHRTASAALTATPSAEALLAAWHGSGTEASGAGAEASEGGERLNERKLSLATDAEPSNDVVPANGEKAANGARKLPSRRSRRRDSKRVFKHRASFALSFSDDPMHPKITDAELTKYGGQADPINVTAATTPSDGSPRVSGSPGWDWLQQLGISDDASGVTGRLVNFPSASAWLDRKSRQWLGLPPRDRRGPKSVDDRATSAAAELRDTNERTILSDGAIRATRSPRPRDADHAAGAESQHRRPPRKPQEVVRRPDGGISSEEDNTHRERHVGFARDAPVSVFAEEAASPHTRRQNSRQYSRGRSDLSMHASLAFASSEIGESSEETDEDQGQGNLQDQFSMPQTPMTHSDRFGSEAALQSDKLATTPPNFDDGPVFVPIIMSMAKQDHKLLVQQWCLHQGLEADEEAISKVCRRLQILQDYLTSYATCNVPIFNTSLVDMNATTDLLHEYLLECISIQMEDTTVVEH